MEKREYCKIRLQPYFRRVVLPKALQHLIHAYILNHRYFLMHSAPECVSCKFVITIAMIASDYSWTGSFPSFTTHCVSKIRHLEAVGRPIKISSVCIGKGDVVYKHCAFHTHSKSVPTLLSVLL